MCELAGWLAGNARDKPRRRPLLEFPKAEKDRNIILSSVDLTLCIIKNNNKLFILSLIFFFF